MSIETPNPDETASPSGSPAPREFEVPHDPQASREFQAPAEFGTPTESEAPPKFGALTEKQKMLAGALYNANDIELIADRAAAAEWIAAYNAAATADRPRLLRQQLAQVGENTEIRPPFYCDYGSNIVLGSGVFLNFNCVILDVANVSIGDQTQIGPAVQIYAADHPRDPAQRRAGKELGRKVAIGRNVWIGGGSIILPGITIGDDAIVGAGSVVTHDVRAGATVAGNPARLIPRQRPIG